MEVFVLLLLALGLLFFGSLFLYWGFGIRWQWIPDEWRVVFYNLIVPDETKVVIHRLGQFRRLAGPGPVVLRWGEEIVHTIDISPGPHQVRADKLFIRGIPFHYVLDIWYQVDPEACATDKSELARLAHYKDSDRKKLIRTEVRDALYKAIQIADTALPPKNPVLANLVPIVPRFPPNDKLLQDAQDLLDAPLRNVGVILTPGHRFVIADMALDSGIGAELSKDIMIRLLKEQFPEVDQEMYLQAVASITGKTLPKTIIDENTDRSIDYSFQADGSVKPTRTRSPSNQNQKTDKAVEPKPQQTTTAAEEVFESDWDVMKELPAA